VLQDLLGLNVDFVPKFVRKFVDGAEVVTGALSAYDEAVKARSFPSADEGY